MVTVLPAGSGGVACSAWPSIDGEGSARDDLHAVHGQREGVGGAGAVAVGGGELAQVAEADRTGDPGQPGHGGCGSAAVIHLSTRFGVGWAGSPRGLGAARLGQANRERVTFDEYAVRMAQPSVQVKGMIPTAP